jgi:hypothetical protein
MAAVFVCALSGCNYAPNVPGVTPYATSATGQPFGNYVGRGTKALPGGMNGYNLPGGAYNNSITGGMTGGTRGGTTGGIRTGSPGMNRAGMRHSATGLYGWGTNNADRWGAMPNFR